MVRGVSFTTKYFMQRANLMLTVMLALLATLAGCNKDYRNVLFNTPREYQKMGLAVIRLNPDSSYSNERYQHRIQPDDQIAVRFLNNFDISEGVTMTEQGAQGITFLVDKEGYVSMPMVGRIPVAGETKQTAQAKLEEAYSKHFKSPNVEVTILNLSVSVQGEVGSPGVYPLKRERTTLLEILAEAGGISPFGKQHVVKVIRGAGQDKDPEVFIFDLRQMGAVKTSDLILRDKDVIYVEPRDIQVVGAKIAPYSNFLTILSTIATISVVVINLTR
jgi:polysaccharide export outer membrane protein